MTVTELKRKIETVSGNIRRYDGITEFSRKALYLSNTLKPCNTYEGSLKVLYTLLNKKFNHHYPGLIDRYNFEKEIDYLFNNVKSNNLLDIE